MTTTTENPQAGPRPAPRKRWYRRPWIVPLMGVTAVFLIFSLTPYLSLDPADSRSVLREGSGLHYPLLVSHIAFGTVAIVTCCFQVWPWFRQRHPVWHRRLGRLYWWGGVLPAGLLAFPVAALSAQGNVTANAGNMSLAVLWLAYTFAGYRQARRRRFGEHRRWMVRSFALTTSIVLNRVWLVLLLVVFSVFVDPLFGGDQDAALEAAIESSVWLSWTVNLALAEWWLARGARRAKSPDRARPAPAVVS